jgi:hypothetical protein
LLPLLLLALLLLLLLLSLLLLSLLLLLLLALLLLLLLLSLLQLLLPNNAQAPCPVARGRVQENPGQQCLLISRVQAKSSTQPCGCPAVNHLVTFF